MHLDDGEDVQRLTGKVMLPRVKCRACGIPMNSDAENRLGIHVRCVYDIEQKRKTRSHPGPRYGRRRS
jgi:hypothetical protein